MSDLDEILNGEELQKQEPPQEEATTGEEEEAAPPTAEDQDTQPEEPPQTVPLAALEDERRKRKEADKMRQMYEAQLERLMGEPKETQEDENVFWENPQEAIQKAVTSETERLQQQFQNTLWNLSEKNARRAHDDFDQVNEYFFETLAPQNPALVEQAKADPDPYDFIYRTAKAQKELSEVGDINGLKEKLRAELLAELEASKKAEIEAEIKKRSSLPGTLSNVRATGGNTTPSTGDESLEDIFGR